MARIGRPSKFNSVTADAIVRLVEGGNFQHVAARAAGVSPRTVADWLAKGRKLKSGPFVEFLQRFKQAEATAESRMVGIVLAAAERDWKAAGFYLERKHGRRWGKPDRNVIVKAGSDSRLTVEEVTRAAGTTPRA